MNTKINLIIENLMDILLIKIKYIWRIYKLNLFKNEG